MERKNDRLPVFTERFKELQGDRSQTEFANFLGISRQTVGFYYNGDRVPDALTLVKISQQCGVSADWLLGLSTVPTPDIDIKGICEQTGLSENSVICLKKHCGTRNNDFVLALIDNLLFEENWLHWQAFARQSARLQAISKMSAPLSNPLKSFSEALLTEMNNARFPFITRDTPRTVEIPTQDASLFYLDQVAKSIEEIVSKTVKEYGERMKEAFDEIKAIPLTEEEKVAAEAEMKATYYAALEATKKMLKEDKPN